MNSKMFASLEAAMEKLVDKWIDMSEWNELDFYYHENIPLRMAEAAKIVFDMAVEAAKEAEEQL